MEKILNIVIVCDGELPSKGKTSYYLDYADIIIACDGATKKILDIGYVPSYIVGDMDSLDLDLQKKFENIIYQSPCQETNDQTKAFKFALTLDPTSIIFLGNTGGREDHSLGNLSLLLDYQKEIENQKTDIQIRAVTNLLEIYPILDSIEFNTKIGAQISLVSLYPELIINSSTGLKYPTNNLKLSNWWKGTLNEATENVVTLNFKEPAPCLLMIHEPIKV